MSAIKHADHGDRTSLDQELHDMIQTLCINRLTCVPPSDVQEVLGLLFRTLLYAYLILSNSIIDPNKFVRNAATMYKLQVMKSKLW